MPSWAISAVAIALIWVSTAAHAEPFAVFPDGEVVESAVLQRAVSQFIEIAALEKKYGRDSVEVARGVRASHETLAAAGVSQDIVALGMILITGSVSGWYSSAGKLPFEERDIPRGLELLKAAAARTCHYRSQYSEGKCEAKRISVPAMLRDHYRDGIFDYQTDPKRMKTCVINSPSIREAKGKELEELLRACYEESSVRIYRMSGDPMQAQYWEKRALACDAEVAKINKANNCD